MNKFLIAIVLLFVSVSISFAQLDSVQSKPKEQNKIAEIGSVKISIPAPVGFEDMANAPEFLDELLKNLSLNPENALLAAFISSETVKKFKANQMEDIRLFDKAMVRVTNAYKDKHLDAATFSSMVSQLRKSSGKIFDANNPQMKSKIESLEKGVAKRSDGEMKLDFSGIENLGEFESTDDFYSHLILMKLNYKIGDADKEFLVINAATFARVKNRLVYFYIYRDFKSKEDFDIIKKQSHDWMSKIIEVNKQ